MKLLSSLILTGLASLAPVLLATETQQYTDNVVVLFDGSGSMQGNIDNKSKIDAAKIALLSALDHIPEETLFGFIAFSGTTNGWAYELQAFDKDRVWNQVKAIRPGGNTPLGYYMKMGADRLMLERQKQYNYGTYRLIVITDGEASDSDRMNAYAKELVHRGITLNVIGVGMKSDHSLKKTAHQYVAANNVQALGKAVSSFLAEIPDSPQDDLNQENPYECLDALINNETALALIDALSESGNHPLGDKP